MGRISRQVMFMDMARAASRRSTCFRLNVGAMVVHKNNPVSAGWNGQQAGHAHCSGNDCPGIIPGNCNTLHAEDNALRTAANILSSGEDVDLYVTHSPCSSCLDRIMNGSLRVERVFFEVPYRSVTHLGMLLESYQPSGLRRRRRTEVYEVTAAGYVVEYFSRKVVDLP